MPVAGSSPAMEGQRRLALVAGYPFNGVLHSPWRYVVLADREIAEVAENL